MYIKAVQYFHRNACCVCKGSGENCLKDTVNESALYMNI